MSKKLLAIAAACGAITTLVAFSTWSLGIFDDARPWASRSTEVVVAGWQADRLQSQMNDVQSRINRLEWKRQNNPNEWTREDEFDLRQWLKTKDRLENDLRDIDKYQRPVVPY